MDHKTDLVEMDVIPEMRISVQFRVTTVDGPSTSFVSAENVDNTMLNLLGNGSKVHVLDVSINTSV